MATGGGAAALDAWVQAAGRALRVAVAETWHPDGAMVGWLSGSATPGRLEVLSVPTQEALGLVGPEGLRAAWRGIAREFRPDLIVVHPPYDLIDPPTASALASSGVRLVGLAFDEPLFQAPRRDPAVAPRFSEVAGLFDAYGVTGRGDVAALAALGVFASHLRFSTSLSPFLPRAAPPAAAGSPLEKSAVLVGRAYARRVELVSALAAAGVPVRVYGRGWAEAQAARGLTGVVPVSAHLSRGQMNAVLELAGAVITTGDWEDVAVPMVKYRHLEAAMLGAPQAVQASPDLADYFAADEVRAWSTPADAVVAVTELLSDPAAARAMGARARRRVLDEHVTEARLGELLVALGSRAPEPRPVPGTAHAAPEVWRILAALVAHDAERRGDLHLAASSFARLHASSGSADAAAGLQRLALTGAPLAATPPRVVPFDTTTAAGLHVGASALAGTGLGRVGHLDPSAERLATAFAIAPSVEIVALAASLGGDTVVAMAAMLEVPEPPSDEAAWHALLGAALAASPGLLGASQRAHRARWEAGLRRLSRP